MSYRVNRALGFQRWGVTNPWVFANYGQPQRHRGYVSPMVFQSGPPGLKTAHLGAASLSVPSDANAAEAELLRRADAEAKRSERMEHYALAGLVISVASLGLAWNFYSKAGRRMAPNRRRRRRRRTSRR